mmetsp:Transcript_13564/g.36289  ORF Transcript_13564/g.36289 Transcript_13564/m.36289 type:complete len:315 (-) Transcript_13564:178-1122(-)|eukprot:CAMPEP_0185172086 /NCGR_PEP_ID=MMETSP1139-20130426/21024_1 /TAXON_ID=298111 /ORGANISM="Pavlova sp., Strain CCMP459" /LENGTH=314 /DNA_ID=CAMNT_0027737711 /DNA_START=67 /DNA_END=1011 /DNA_ORIENTATION=+
MELPHGIPGVAALADLSGLGAYRCRPPARTPEPSRREVVAQAVSRELHALPRDHDYETAYERHRRFMREYGARDRGIPSGATTGEDQPRPSQHYKGEYDIAREHNRFVWRDEDEDGGNLRREERVAKKYYDRLFKEYAIVDLSRYETGQVGLRWRTEREVIDGRGQFSCGNRSCTQIAGLCSYEVHFRYSERREQRSTLVKVRVCPACARLLNHRHEHAKAKTNWHATGATQGLERAQDRDHKPQDSCKSRKRSRERGDVEREGVGSAQGIGNRDSGDAAPRQQQNRTRREPFSHDARAGGGVNFEDYLHSMLL